MDLVTPTIARLQGLPGPHAGKRFLDVEGAMELAGIIETGNPKRSPTAYVICNRELPKAAVEGTGPAVQDVQVDIVVVTAIKATNSAKGESTALEETRRAVVEALFDWSPAEGADPYTRGPSQLLAFRNGWIFWADTFRTDFWE